MPSADCLLSATTNDLPKKNTRPIEIGRALDEELSFLKGRALLGRMARLASLVDLILYRDAKKGAALAPQGLTATGRRNGAPSLLKAFIAAIAIVRSTRSFGSNASAAAE